MREVGVSRFGYIHFGKSYRFIRFAGAFYNVPVFVLKKSEYI